MGLYSNVWGSSGTAGTRVAEVAAPSGKLWLMNVNLCQARSRCSPGSISELGWTHRKHTHIHTHTRKGKDNPHLSDGWYGSRTTHHFSISVSSHSALSLILPAPINLAVYLSSLQFLLRWVVVVCCLSFMLYPALVLPFLFSEMCSFTGRNTYFTVRPDSCSSSSVSIRSFRLVHFIDVTPRYSIQYINQS